MNDFQHMSGQMLPPAFPATIDPFRACLWLQREVLGREETEGCIQIARPIITAATTCWRPCEDICSSSTPKLTEAGADGGMEVRHLVSLFLLGEMVARYPGMRILRTLAISKLNQLSMLSRTHA